MTSNQLDNAKIISFGFDLFNSIILAPPLFDFGLLDFSATIDPQDILLSRDQHRGMSTYSGDEWTPKEATDNIHTIGSSPMKTEGSNLGEAFSTTPHSHSDKYNQVIGAQNESSFYNGLPSSAISQPEIVLFNDGPLGFDLSAAAESSFHGKENISSSVQQPFSTSGTTSSSAIVCATPELLSRQKSSDQPINKIQNNVYKENVYEEEEFSVEYSHKNEVVSRTDIAEQDCVEKQKVVNKSYASRRMAIKKTRKNYASSTVDTLMNHYLVNNGTIPSGNCKRKLAITTGKTEVQIATWFQNARRRYQDKLRRFQLLNREHPRLVYDNATFKAYLKSYS